MPSRWPVPLVLIAVAPAATRAEPTLLPPTRVETSSADETTLGTGTATVVEPEAKTGGGLELADLIETQPGVHLRRFGGPGEYAAISLRGLGPENVAVILDELPLTSSTLGPVDLSLVPLAAIERLEIYRGVGPVRFQAPLGGVLRLVTRAPTDRTALTAHVGAGSFSSYTAHLLASGPSADLRYTAMFHSTMSAGDFRYRDDRATLYNQDDDRWRRRKNNEHRDLFLRLGAETDVGNGGMLRLTSQAAWRTAGVPGPGNAVVKSARADGSETAARLGLTALEVADGRTRVGAGLDLLTSSRQFRDPHQETGLRTSGADTRVDQFGVDGRVEVLWNLHHESEIAPRGQWQRFHQRGHASAAAIGALRHEATRRSLGLGLEHRAELAGLRLVPAARLDWVADDAAGAAHAELQPSPRLGLLWPLGACELRANAGRFHRYPTLLERYGDGGATFVANLELEPEQGLFGDGALTCRGRLPKTRQASVHLGGFVTRATQLIAVTQVSALRLVANNVGRTDIAGLEASVTTEARWLAGTLSYTFTRAADASRSLLVGNQTPGIPRHALDAEIGLGPDWLRLAYQLSLASQTFLDRANLLPLPPRLLHHVELRCRDAHTGLELAVTVRNLADLRATSVALPRGRQGIATLSDFIGYPLPGRSFFAALLWRTP